MKVSLTNLILIILLITVSALAITFYTDLQEAKNIIKKYEDIEGLTKKTADFVKNFVRGKGYEEYLTGAELKKYKSIEETTLGHSAVNVEKINIKQLFTKTIDHNHSQAESYAVVEVRYTEYCQTLVLKSNWIKDSEQWKINHLEVSLLGDSQDEILRKQAQEALQNS
mgnify:CR=1 FL=1